MRTALIFADRHRVHAAHLAVLAVLSLAALIVLESQVGAVAVQAGAFVVGGLILLIVRLDRLPRFPPEGVAIVCLAALAAPILTGPDVQGARRWLALGPMLVQPAALVLPVALVALCTIRQGVVRGLLGLGAAGLLALQPDGGGLLAWTLGIGGVALARRDIPSGVVAGLSGALAIWVLTRPDALPVVPYVERIAQTTVAQLPALGLAVWMGLFSLPVPFAIAAMRPQGGRGQAIALAGLWTGWLVANLVGNYPAPVLGLGASMVAGWAISLALLDRALEKTEAGAP